MEKRLEELIGKRLRRRGLRLAVAESCTGGLVGHRLTNVPGSSDYFLGGVLSYANEIKERLLGVSRETLLRQGAVSRSAVLEMAAGVRRAVVNAPDLAQTVGLAVSGIAGPGGGTPDKPVGLVWIGLSTPEGDWASEHHFEGDREQVKAQAADQALRLLAEYLKENFLQPVWVESKTVPGNVVIPITMIWQGRSYMITDIGRRWNDEDGQHVLVLTAEQQSFELVLAPDGVNWFLNTSSLPTFYV